jgi:hypothetical protein
MACLDGASDPVDAIPKRRCALHGLLNRAVADRAFRSTLKAAGTFGTLRGARAECIALVGQPHLIRGDENASHEVLAEAVDILAQESLRPRSVLGLLATGSLALQL